VKADPAQQVLLLDVQACDIKLSQLRHAMDSLPEHAAIAALDGEEPSLRAELASTEAEAGQLKQAAERVDVDVEQVRARVAKDEAAIASGALGAKELEAMQHELVSLARRQKELEDEELEILQGLEDLQAKAKRFEAERSEIAGKRAGLVASRDAAIAEFKSQMAVIESERADFASRLDGELLKFYEKVRADHGGVGAAALRGGSCEGCQLQLPPSERTRVQGLPVDEVPRCDECGRILVRV
jgi:predicted  nucleic acid-binding Zn-ribbon protein